MDNPSVEAISSNPCAPSPHFWFNGRGQLTIRSWRSDQLSNIDGLQICRTLNVRERLALNAN